jgi:hypothetical protein
MLVLLGSGCGGGRLGAGALSQQSKVLRSNAAEGALLAGLTAAGKSTSIYTREQSSVLYEAASATETSLKMGRAEPGLKRELRRLAALAGRVSADLERLTGASKREARWLRRQLQAAAEEAKRIGQRLS